jgi:hypothetical protein
MILPTLCGTAPCTPARIFRARELSQASLVPPMLAVGRRARPGRPGGAFHARIPGLFRLAPCHCAHGASGRRCVDGPTVPWGGRRCPATAAIVSTRPAASGRCLPSPLIRTTAHRRRRPCSSTPPPTIPWSSGSIVAASARSIEVSHPGPALRRQPGRRIAIRRDPRAAGSGGTPPLLPESREPRARIPASCEYPVPARGRDPGTATLTLS